MIRKIKRLAALLLLAVVTLGFATTPAAGKSVSYLTEEGSRVRDYASCQVKRLLETMSEDSCNL